MAVVGNESRPQGVEFYVKRLHRRAGPLTRLISERNPSQEETLLLRWTYGEKLLNFLEVCGLYEQSYQKFFSNNPDSLEEVCRYTDVYDIDELDIKAGDDFALADEGHYTHIQDIAIRRSVLSLKRRFSGDKGRPLQVRSTSRDEIGVRLSPFSVPFVDVGVITPNPVAKGSWDEASIEHFYQANRRVIVSLGSSAVVAADVTREMLGQRIQSQLGESIQLVPVSFSDTQ